MILLARLWSVVAGSFWGRIMSGAVLAFGALLANNAYQRSKGAKQERVRIIEKTNEVAKKRDVQIRKKRNRRKPSDIDKRLLQFQDAGSD